MFEQDIRLGPGTGTSTEHTLEILIMLAVAGLLGLWLGWILWSRYKQEAEKMRLDNVSLNATAEALRIELAAGKATLSTAQADNSNFAAQVASLTRNNANLRDRVAELEDLLNITEARNRVVETELGLSYTPDTPIADDIPLEIAALAQESPYTTSSDDADLTPPPVVVTLDAPDAQPSIEDIVLPTKPLSGHLILEVEQSASEPSEEAPADTTAPLIVVEETPPAPAPKTRTRAKAAAATAAEAVVPVAAASEPDDLTVVEGIGPKIQMLLNQYGIYTYHELAETEVSRLKEILQTAGPQLAMHDPGTWPSQANLAANDQWDALKSIQGFLKGGKKPT